MDFRLLHYHEFEYLCCCFLKAEGFEQRSVPAIAHDLGNYLTFESPKSEIRLVQIKHNNSAQIITRLRRTVARLLETQEYLAVDTAMLISSGPLTKEEIISLPNPKFHYWNESTIRDLMKKHQGITDEFTRYLEQQFLFERRIHNPDLKNSRAEELIRRLLTRAAIESQAERFEKLCIEIINFAFIPPLRVLLFNRRAIQDSNGWQSAYAIEDYHPLWERLRLASPHNFIFVESVSGNRAIGREDVVLIGKRLSSHGGNSTAIVCSLQKPTVFALNARRKTWLESHNLILFLAVDDLLEILRFKSINEDPPLGFNGWAR